MKKGHGILKFPAQLEICNAAIFFLLDVFGCVFVGGGRLVEFSSIG